MAVCDSYKIFLQDNGGVHLGDVVDEQTIRVLFAFVSHRYILPAVNQRASATCCHGLDWHAFLVSLTLWFALVGDLDSAPEVLFRGGFS